jgi:hypothetical protein
VGLASDAFESASFSGGVGRWIGNWTIGGDARIRTNLNGPHSGSNHVRLRGTTALMRRTVDLLATTGGHLTFWGKANLFGGSDRLLIEVSVDGGPFTTLHTITNAASDNTYRFYEIDLSGPHRVRFERQQRRVLRR